MIFALFKKKYVHKRKNLFIMDTEYEQETKFDSEQRHI